MDKLQKWLQKWLMPIAEVLERQKHLQAVKDGIVGIVPIIIIGSFCLVPTGIGNMLGGGISGPPCVGVFAMPAASAGGCRARAE